VKLSIIIPFYNEEETIEEIINRVLEIPLELKKEIILVDDFSRDQSREKAQSLADKHNNIKYPAMIKTVAKERQSERAFNQQLAT